MTTISLIMVPLLVGDTVADEVDPVEPLGVLTYTVIVPLVVVPVEVCAKELAENASEATRQVRKIFIGPFNGLCFAPP